MNIRSLLKYVPPAGPVLGLLLIGLVLTSALLYYRAVKIQRYLEPALALTQPRNAFNKNINAIFVKEFGKQPVPGLTVKSSSIIMDWSLLFSSDGTVKPSAQEDLRKLARVFLSLMTDDHTRSDISLILVLARYPLYHSQRMRVTQRASLERMLGFIQDGIFFSEPELGTRFSKYFAITVQPASHSGMSRELVEFRIVPSEYLHIEVLEKLQKYAF